VHNIITEETFKGKMENILKNSRSDSV